MSHLSVPVQQFPAIGSAQRVSSDNENSGRKKVILKPGRSLMDWIRYSKSGKDLSGFGRRRIEVTKEELAKHNTEDDCWMVIRGKVYNITPYFEYHPGGVEELMRAAGGDGTKFFDEVHKWVNVESMLEGCYIGKLKAEGLLAKSPAAQKLYSNLLTAKGAQSSSLMPPPPPPVFPKVPNTNSLIKATESVSAVGSSINMDQPKSAIQVLTQTIPRHDWFQTDVNLTITFYTKSSQMRHENVIIDKAELNLTISVIIEDKILTFNTGLEDDITSNYHVKVSEKTGKVDVILEKMNPGKQWKSLGKDLKKDFISVTEKDPVFRRCKLQSKHPVTHDTSLYCFEFPQGCRMCVPLGYHVHVKASVEGMEIARSYTAILPSFNKDEDPDVLKWKNGQVIFLMIKHYPDGTLTPTIEELEPEQSIYVSNFEGNFIEQHLIKHNTVVLLAAGTGITPMLGILYRTLVEQQTDDRTIKLIFFNKQEKDILWRSKLDSLAEQNEKFSVTYVLSEPHEKWTGPQGRIGKHILDESILSVEEGQVLVCACGPTAFTEKAVRLAKDVEQSRGSITVHAFLG